MAICQVVKIGNQQLASPSMAVETEYFKSAELKQILEVLFLNPLIEQIEMVTNESCYNDRH